MKRWTALLLACMLCLCAAGAMAEERGELVLNGSNSFDIYPNGYTVENEGTTVFYPYSESYIISGSSIGQDTPLEFHANEYDTYTQRPKAESWQSVVYNVTFKDLLIESGSGATAIRFGADEGDVYIGEQIVSGCHIQLVIANLGNNSVKAGNHPAFQYSFSDSDEENKTNNVEIIIHNSHNSSLYLDGNYSDPKKQHVIGDNITVTVDGGTTISSADRANWYSLEITTNSCSKTNDHGKIVGKEATCEASGNKEYWH